MKFVSSLFAQLQSGPQQSEYFAAYALIIALVLLGVVVVCIPRPRQKHFVEPTEDEDKKKEKKIRKRA